MQEVIEEKERVLSNGALSIPVEEQLQRKRQEVMAARQQLDVLMQQQLHLEAAVRGVHPPGR